MSRASSAPRGIRALILAGGAALVLGAALFALWPGPSCGCAPEPHPPASAQEEGAPGIRGLPTGPDPG